MTEGSCVQGRAEHGDFPGVEPVVPTRAIGAIRGGTGSKQA
jgi:hypothetical protein